MNFQSRHYEEPLEINLIPLIDVLLVILVFLAASTSFTQQRQLQLDLPKAEANAIADEQYINLLISKEGIFTLNDNFIEADNSEDLVNAINNANSGKNLTLRIQADKQTAHGVVIQALEAARLSQIERINFLTETGP